MAFARKMPELYMIITREIFSRILRARVPPLAAPRLLRL